jgi:hypothetical protein
MSILNIFKSKKQREIERMEAFLKISSKILDLIKKKRKYSELGILDLDNFDNDMFDKILILEYHKNGVLDFFDSKYRDTIVRVFTSDELDDNYKYDVEISYQFLTGFNNSIFEVIEEIKSSQ